MSEFDFSDSDSVEGVYAPPAQLSQRLPFAPRTTAQGSGVDNIEQYDCDLDATHVVVGPLALAPPIAVFATGVEPVRTTATKLTRDEPLLVLFSCVHGICAIQAPVSSLLYVLLRSTV